MENAQTNVNRPAKSKIENGESMIDDGRERDKLYQCQVCSKKFSTPSNVRRHFQNSHPKQDVQSTQNVQPEQDVQSTILHKVIKSKKESKKRLNQSHDIIKKGFNVCYALDEFIKASLQQNGVKFQ